MIPRVWLRLEVGEMTRGVAGTYLHLCLDLWPEDIVVAWFANDWDLVALAVEVRSAEFEV